jgi:hypothetical protein
MRTPAIAFLLTLATLVSAASHAACSSDQPALAEIAASKNHTLSAPLSIAELESANMFKIRETGEVLPFGYGHKQWLEFKVAVAPDDKIYFMTRQSGTFYMDGHILVRNGCVMRFLKGGIS